MGDIFQIEEDENKKSSSCTGSIEISYDGGETYQIIGHGLMLDVDWDKPAVMDLVGHSPEVGRAIDYSVGYIVAAQGSVVFFDDLQVLGSRSTGIVNHRSVETGDRQEITAENVLENINNLISEFERSAMVKGPIWFDCSPSVQLCIDALKNDHYAHLVSTGGHVGKGKKAHKKMRRKMFGGW